MMGRHSDVVFGLNGSRGLDSKGPFQNRGRRIVEARSCADEVELQMLACADNHPKFDTFGGWQYVRLLWIWTEI